MPHDTSGFRHYVKECNNWEKTKEAKVNFNNPKYEGYGKDLSSRQFLLRHKIFSYKISDTANTIKIPPQTGLVNLGGLIVDKSHGLLRMQESVTTFFDAYNVFVSTNFVILAGLVKGTESRPKFAFALAPKFLGLPPSAQISLSGKITGNLDNINTDFQVDDKPYSDGGEYSVLDQVATEHKVLIAEKSGDDKNYVLIKGGNLTDYPLDASLDSGRIIVSRHYFNAIYDMHYKIYLFFNGLKLDSNGLVSGKLIFGSDNRQSELIDVVFK